MSCTVRFETGNLLGEALSGRLTTNEILQIGLRQFLYWAGIGRGSVDGNWNRKYKFAIRLPVEAAMAVRILWRLKFIEEDLAFGVLVRRSAKTLARDIRQALGLPPIGDELWEMEERFVKEIMERGGDLALWLVYADWLEEHGDKEEQHLRAEAIRCWNEKKKIKMVKGRAPQGEGKSRYWPLPNGHKRWAV